MGFDIRSLWDLRNSSSEGFCGTGGVVTAAVVLSFFTGGARSVICTMSG